MKIDHSKVINCALFAFIFLFSTCKQTSTPTVITLEVSDVTYNSAKSGGDVTTDGGSTVTARGVCWNTTKNPTILNSTTSDSTGVGQFKSSIIGLNANTTYHLRAYASNSIGTSYGSEMIFTTLIEP